jgi:glycosyltransferase involved in cell wall biosynthesis
MSVYNGEKFLKEAVDSILCQTYSDFEFIIINDASTDKTKEILGTYSDKRLRIVNNIQNIGLTRSLNKGLTEAKGEYIARMDSDDISLPERLDMQKRFMDSHPDIVCAGTGLILIDSFGNVTNSKTVIVGSEMLKFFLILKNHIAHSSVIFRKKNIQQVGGYDDSVRYAQDYNLWSKLLSNGCKIENIQKPLLKYRLHTQSITQGNNKDEAYYSAIKTTRLNISRYIKISSLDFEIFMRSYHRHTIETMSELYIIIKTWNQFKKNYITREKPNSAIMPIIKSYINIEQINSLRWYFRTRYSNLYKVIAKLKRSF